MWTVSSKLPSLIWPSGYYSLLIVQASSDKVGERSLRIIKKDIRVSGQSKRTGHIFLYPLRGREGNRVAGKAIS